MQCFIEVVDNSKGIIIITNSKEIQESICTQMLVKIIREIKQAKDDFCATITFKHYLMDSNDPASLLMKINFTL